MKWKHNVEIGKSTKSVRLLMLTYVLQIPSYHHARRRRKHAAQGNFSQRQSLKLKFADPNYFDLVQSNWDFPEIFLLKNADCKLHLH